MKVDILFTVDDEEHVITVERDSEAEAYQDVYQQIGHSIYTRPSEED